LPQQDKIKYFNFLLENDINFSRDESGNYVALVKVLNPAFYGRPDANANQSFKKEQSKIENVNVNNVNVPSEQKSQETKLKSEKNKTSKNASRSMPKNLDKKGTGDNKRYKLDNSNLSGYNDNSSIGSKKKFRHKSKERFEKEKKTVSNISYLFIINLIFYSYKKKMSWIYSKVDIKNS
jgi:hypothetical protein